MPDPKPGGPIVEPMKTVTVGLKSLAVCLNPVPLRVDDTSLLIDGWRRASGRSSGPCQSMPASFKSIAWARRCVINCTLRPGGSAAHEGLAGPRATPP